MTLEQKNNTLALSISIGLHLLLLLLFLVIKYTAPVFEPIEEYGMEVNLGTSEDGFGFEQPEWLDDPAPLDDMDASPSPNQENLTQTFTDPSGEVAVPEHVNTQRADRTPNTQTTSPNTNNQQARPQEPRYTYQGGTGTGGNAGIENLEGGSEGNTVGAGDRGVPGGTPGAENYEGTPGSGGGNANVRHNFRSRSFVQKPSPEAKFNTGGTVKIFVTINSNGDIIKSTIEAPNAELRRIAQEKLKGVKFNKVDAGRAEEVGYIYFDFKTGR